ncbi:MAG: TSUP family transporter [Acidimicrobiia bacterium]
MVTVPLGVVGALAARTAPVSFLRGVYGIVMVGLALVSWQHRPSSGVAYEGDKPVRTVTAATGDEYRYPVPRLSGQRIASGAGALLAGLISTGVGEATLPGLVRRYRFPVPVAAATTTVVVATAVAAISGN